MKRVILFVGGLVCAAVMAALALAALVRPSALIASLLFTTTLGLLSTATALAFVRDRPRRAFWTGLAAFGWAYFSLGFPWAQNDGVNPPLLLPALLLLAVGPYGEGFDRFILFDIGYYLPVGQCLATAAFALGGAVLVRFITKRSTQ